MAPTTESPSTIGAEEIERSSCPTPSEASSLYLDFDKEEVELPPSCGQNQDHDPLSTPPTQATLALEDSSVDNPHISPTLNTKDTEHEVVSRLIIPPSTPSNRLLSSLHASFRKVDISPTSSSERSNFSSSTLADEEPESPNTQRSSSPTPVPLITSEALKSVPAKTEPKNRLPCLRCQVAGLSCSLSAPPQKRRPPSKNTPKDSCTRCARNGENFCILQVAIEKEVVDRCRTRTQESKSSEKECEYTYYAEGVEREVVSEKAQEILEAERAKMRFALPAWSVARKNLKPVFGGWLTVQEEIEGSEGQEM